MALAVGFASGTPTPYTVPPHRTPISSLFNRPSPLPPSHPEATGKLTFNGRALSGVQNPDVTMLPSASPSQLSELQLPPEAFRQESYGRKPILPQPPLGKYKRAGVLPPKGYEASEQPYTLALSFGRCTIIFALAEAPKQIIKHNPLELTVILRAFTLREIATIHQGLCTNISRCKDTPFHKQCQHWTSSLSQKPIPIYAGLQQGFKHTGELDTIRSWQCAVPDYRCATRRHQSGRPHRRCSQRWGEFIAAQFIPAQFLWDGLVCKLWVAADCRCLIVPLMRCGVHPAWGLLRRWLIGMTKKWYYKL